MPGATVDARLIFTVPAAMLGVVKGGGAAKPKKFMAQVPAAGIVPNGSAVVFAMVKEVSNPAWFVTNGNSRIVLVLESEQVPAGTPGAPCGPAGPCTPAGP